ncbi:MAG: helix-turn-helix domain-containing protein [Firmicutes bacterium]|nr:helix-turn-helix domain-containing protein [Bacillota bacterium]
MITGRQLKAARILLGWTQPELVNKSGVKLQTVQRMESKGPAHSTHDNAQKVIDTLKAAGAIFIDDGDASTFGGSGVRLKS